MFIPPFIPFFYNNDNRPIDRKKALILCVTLLVILSVFIPLFILMTWFNFNIFKYISTTTFFIIAGLFGFFTPILVKRIIK